MRIASIYTVYSRRCGAELLSERILAAATERFPESRWTVFCNREAYQVLGEVAPRVERVPIPWLDNQYAKAFWLEFLAAKAVDALAPDVFWNPSGCNHFPGRWQAPTLTTFLDLAEYRVQAKYDFKRRMFRRRICIPRSLRRSAAFTAISRYTAEDMVRFLKVAAPVSVIHCGPSAHGEEPCRVSSAALPDLPSGVVSGRYFLVPGRTDFEGKGLDVLLAAYDRLAADWPEGVQIVFVGPPGTGHERFRQQLRRSDAGRHQLAYLGRVETEVLDALYGHCLATVIPSRSEGFGFPVLEAMGHGVPVICSDAGSLPEVVGDAALMFASGQPGELAAHLLAMARGHPSRRELIERGRRQVGLFSWDRCAREMMARLEDAARKGGKSGGEGGS